MHVILVGLQVLHPALLDQLDHPARIEIHAEADAAAMLRQVFDAKAQDAADREGPSISQFEPRGKYSSGSVSLNSLVIGSKVVAC